MLANVGGFDGQFAMTAVDEHGQLHAPRPPVIKKCVERGADSAAGEEHIVADDHIAALDVDADGAWGYHRANIRRRQIVAVELDVEHAGVDSAFLDSGDQLAQPLGQRNAAPLDADQGQVGAAIALFNNLVGQAHQRALDLGGGHQPALDAQEWFAISFAH